MECLTVLLHDKVGDHHRRENGSDRNTVYLPSGPKEQGQAADGLSLQQEESGSHRKEEQRTLP